jgi:hypothetical protein
MRGNIFDFVVMLLLHQICTHGGGPRASKSLAPFRPGRQLGPVTPGPSKAQYARNAAAADTGRASRRRRPPSSSAHGDEDVGPRDFRSPPPPAGTRYAVSVRRHHPGGQVRLRSCHPFLLAISPTRVSAEIERSISHHFVLMTRCLLRDGFYIDLDFGQ